jgi:hypothetical protein
MTYDRDVRAFATRLSVVRAAFFTSAEPAPGPCGLIPVKPYDPPDPTLIEVKPEALDFWSRTLELPPEKIKKAVLKVGPVLDTVKKELGIGGPE